MHPNSPVELSVIVPVGSRHSDMSTLYAEYKRGVIECGVSFEFVFVLDGPLPVPTTQLKQLIADGERITFVALTRTYGEATAIMSGFENASGGLIVTLPAYFQIEGSEIRKLVEGLSAADLVVGRRWPRVGGVLERLRRRAFHGLLSQVTRLEFHDLGCNARAMKRKVLEEISLYGDQHRFLAVLADRQGFKVTETDVRQSEQDRFRGTYGPSTYARGFLDIFTVFFLVRFTKKPLRFFGMIGITTFLIGALGMAYLVIERLGFGRSLGDRPALLLMSLLIVLGLQLFALGLLGELIIFTHARQIKDYQVDEVVHFSGRVPTESLDRTSTSNITVG